MNTQYRRAPVISVKSDTALAATAALLSMPSPFADYPGVVRLQEPADSLWAPLSQALLDGSYNKPFLLEDGKSRGLLFGLDFIQSNMRLAAPDALDLIYTHYMMAFVLFHTKVSRLAMLGLGGGSLAKFCYRHLPQIDLTAVEADADVLAYRDAFHIPPDDSRFRVVLADAAQFVSDTAARQTAHDKHGAGDGFDVILVDVFDGKGPAETVTGGDFYHHARRALADKGVLIANVAGSDNERAAHLDFIRHAFGDNLLLVSVDDASNHIAYAFKDGSFEPRWKWIDSQAVAMQQRFQLDFPKIARELQRNWLRGWESVRL